MVCGPVMVFRTCHDLFLLLIYEHSPSKCRNPAGLVPARTVLMNHRSLLASLNGSKLYDIMRTFFSRVGVLAGIGGSGYYCSRRDNKV